MKHIVITIIAIVIIVTGIELYHRDKETKYIAEIYRYKDKLNRQHTKVTGYSKHDTIYRDIIKYVKDKTPNAVIYYKDKIRIDTIVNKIKDTSLLYLGKWGYIKSYDTIIVRDTIQDTSSKLDMELFNEYSVVLGTENQGLFKRPIPYAQVISYNPYTANEAVKSYDVQGYPRTPKLFLSVNLGYGLGLDKQRPILTPYIGIGLSYNLFKIY